MTETTPGQAAYETSYTVRGYPINISWDERDATDRHAWETIGQAAITAAGAWRDAHLRRERAKLDEIRRLCEEPPGMSPGKVWGGKPRHAGDPLADIILDIIGQDPKPAPELDETQSVESLITELGKRDLQINNLQALIGEILSEFDGKGHLDGRHARVGHVQLGKWRDRAGLNSTLPASEPQAGT